MYIPNQIQIKYWDTLKEKLDTLRNSDEQLEQAVLIAEDQGIGWLEVAQMSNNEGYYGYKDPTWALRRIRNSPDLRDRLLKSDRANNE